MSKKVYRFFGGFLEKQENWLNKKADEGWRLVRTEKLLYEFEACQPGALRYKVDFVGHMPAAEQGEYKGLLRELGYGVLSKNINLNWSVGHVRVRPWAKGSARISTSWDTFNKELLIVEKENDGKSFELHTTPEDKRSYCRHQRNMYGVVFLLWAIFGVNFFIKGIPLGGVIFSVLAVLYGIPVIQYQRHMAAT